MTPSLTHAQKQSKLKNLIRCIETLDSRRMKSALASYSLGIEKGIVIWDECADDINVNPFHVVCALYNKHASAPQSPEREQIMQSLDRMSQALIDKNVNVFAPALQEIERTTCMGQSAYRKTAGKTVVQMFANLPPSTMKVIADVDCTLVANAYDYGTCYRGAKTKQVQDKMKSSMNKARLDASQGLADYVLPKGRFADALMFGNSERQPPVRSMQQPSTSP